MKHAKKKGVGSILKRWIVIFFTLFITVIFITLLTGLYGWLKYGDDIRGIAKDAYQKIDSIDSQTFREHEQTILYDINDVEMGRLTSNDYEYLTYDEMNPYIPKSFIAIEDRRFESHKGVDPKALLRAGIAFVKNKGEITQGGSTITQQLVKNIFLSMDQTFSRKFEEMIMAYELEKRHSKDEIIEFYINNINYANGNFSFESASNYYFNKPSKDLSLAEIAFVAAIPNNPSYYNPVKHIDHTIRRQQRILAQMKEAGYINDKEYEGAIKQPVKLNIQERDGVNVTYATSYVVHDAVEILMMNKGFNFEYDFASDSDRAIYEQKYNEKYEEMYEELRSGGYRVYTSIDLNKQSVVQEAVNNGLKSFTTKDKGTGKFETQGAAVLINNKSALVEAIVGGRSQDGVTDWFNRGYQAYRQPGSSIKPLVAYTPTFESGMLASSKIEDKWIKNGPKNAQGRYYGRVTLRYATEMSLNTVAYQLVQKLTPQTSLSYLKKMQFSKIVDDDNYPGIGIGGFTYGVTPLELAGGFSTLSRNGSYIKPSAVRKIENSAEEVIYKREVVPFQVYESGSAYIMTDVLKSVLTEKYASGYGLGVNGMPSAGKTGTTNDSKDGWFSGYTPYYTAVVWVGNDNPKAINRLYGATYPGGIWNDFMSKVHDGLEQKDFVVPNDVHEAYVSYSGKVSEDRVSGWKKEWVTDSYLQNHATEIQQSTKPSKENRVKRGGKKSESSKLEDGAIDSLSETEEIQSNDEEKSSKGYHNSLQGSQTGDIGGEKIPVTDESQNPTTNSASDGDMENGEGDSNGDIGKPTGDPQGGSEIKDPAENQNFQDETITERELTTKEERIGKQQTNDEGDGN